VRNIASRWLSLQEYITMHGPLNAKYAFISLPQATYKSEYEI